MNERPITEDDLHAFIDNELDDARRAAVISYLETHPDIAARLDVYAGQRDEVRAVLDPIMEEPVPTRLNLVHILGRNRYSARAPWRATAAAAGFLLIGGTAGWFLHGASLPPAEGVAALAREATDSYASFASDRVRPVELRSDNMAELVGWASERMGRRPVVPDLSSSGYRLMGGRMIATRQGVGLMLMYDDDNGTRLVMLTRPMAREQDRAMIANTEGHVDGWSWASDGMGYSLVGPIPASELHSLADNARRQILG